jgi:uncharacterized protein (DUF2384 family)
MKDKTRTCQPGPIPNDEAQAMATAVITLFDRWNLSPAQRSIVLGGTQQTTLDRWRRGEFDPITQELAVRLSLLMGIHKALRTLFLDDTRAYAWVSTPNADFEERPPIDTLMDGDIEGFAQIRSYLDAALVAK